MRRDLTVEFRPGAEPMQQAQLGDLELPGAEGSYVSTPDHASLGITAEIDVRVDLTHARWMGDRPRSDWPADEFAAVPLAGKWVNAGDQRSWIFYLASDGRLGMIFSTDGITQDGLSGRGPYVRSGGRTVVRLTYESDDGSGDHRRRFWQGWSMDGPWVLVSEHTDAGVATLFDSTAPLEIGSYNLGQASGDFLLQAMTVHAVQVRDGIGGTVVADPVFDGHTAGTTLFTDSAGRDWTVHGDAHISADVPVPTWVDITGDVESASWTVGRQRDDEDWPPGEATLVLANDQRQYDPENDAGPYFGRLNPRTPFRLRTPVDDVSVLELPSATSLLDLSAGAGLATTPASSQIAGTGDIDIRVRVALADWQTPSFPSLAARWPTTFPDAPADVAWDFWIEDGFLSLTWSDNGSTSATETADVPLEFVAGSTHWVRPTLRVDDGNGRHEVRFWTSEDGVDWMQVGGPQAGTGTNRLWGGSAPITVGATTPAGVGALDGQIYEFELRSGDRVVAHADLAEVPPGLDEWTDRRGNVWSLVSPATVDTDTVAYAATPDHASLGITGNLDVRADLTLADWAPAYDSVVVSKWGTPSERSWLLYITADGRAGFGWSTDGSAVDLVESTVTLTPGTGNRLALKVEFSPAGSDVKFFAAPTIDGPWVQLGATISGAASSLNAGTAALEVGTFNAGELEVADGDFAGLAGQVHAVQVRDGIDGTIVADPDFSDGHAGAGSFADSTGKTWTVNGTATLIDDPAADGDQFWGFVQDGFEQTWQDPADGYCTVPLTDLFGLLPGLVLPGVFEGAILDTQPVAYWRLNESIGITGEEVSDQSDQQHNGQIVGGGITFGEHGLFAGLGDAASFNDGDDGDDVARIDISASRVGRDPFGEAVLVVMRTSDIPSERSLIVSDQDGNNFNTSPHMASFAFGVDDDGEVVVQSTSTGAGGAAAISGPVITDGQPHFVIAQLNGFNEPGIAVDSSVVHDTTATALFLPGSGAAVGGARQSVSSTERQFNGTLQHVVVWDRSLLQADRDHIYGALSGLAGRRSDEQLRWALHQIGVPDELLDLDEGVTRMAVADSGGKDALDFAREIDATEGGAFHVDHHQGGRLRFRSRYTRWLADRSRYIQETFSDDPAATDVVRAERGSLVVQPAGISTVVNTWTVTWAGGEETATDKASRKKYGARGGQLDTQAPTSAYARGLARWMLALTKEPRTLVRGLGINPAAAEAGWPAAIGLQIWDRASFRRQPLATGTVSTRELQIEGAAHQVEGMHRSTEFHTSIAADVHQQLFLADISATDGDHVAAP